MTDDFLKGTYIEDNSKVYDEFGFVGYSIDFSCVDDDDIVAITEFMKARNKEKHDKT